MATSATLNAVTYSIPAVGESNWGTNVSSYLVALSTGVLQKAGGSFTLTADADFGASYGLKSGYFKSRGTVSTTGIVRLANAESVGWRNAANGADKLLKVNSSDILEFDGNPITTLALGAANTVLRMNSGGTATEYAKLVDANIAAAAAIAVNKLAALTASRAVVSDSSGFLASATTTSAEIGYVNGVTSAIQTQLDTKAIGVASAVDSEVALFSSTGGKQLKRGTGTGVAHLTSGVLSASNVVLTSEVSGILPVANGGTASSTALNNNRIMISSASKISENSALTALRALISDSNGLPAVSTVTDVELSFLSGALSVVRGNSDTAILTNKTLTAPDILGGSYINLLTQAAIRFNDDSGGDYIAIKAPTGVTTHTLILPATQGSASTVLTNNGSGTLSWGSALTTALNQYNMNIGDSTNTAAALNTALLGDISGSYSSQIYAVTSAAPGVFTVAASPLTGSKAYVTVTQNGFTANTTYYVTKVSATTFKLATTLANAVAGTNITSSGTTAGVVISGGLSLTSGTIGTVTNDDAVTGYVGEYLTQSRVASSATALTSTVSANVTGTALTLSPGDWDIYAAIGYRTGTGTTVSAFNAGVSKTSATLPGSDIIAVPTSGEMRMSLQGFTITGNGNDISFPITPVRASISTSTTFYLVTNCTFATSTLAAYGSMSARRKR